MELTVLGKYGPFPQAGGACSAYVVEHGNTRILLDCGSGAVSRLLSLFDPKAFDAILLSHLHYDHCADMPIFRYAMQRVLRLDPGRAPLPLIAPREPAGTFPMIDHPVYRLTEAHDGMELAIGELAVRLVAMRHGGIPAYGFDVTASDGARLFYTGDTGWFDALPDLVRGADVLLADACFLDADDRGGPLDHLTARQAGRLAEESGVQKLLCTHIWGGGYTSEAVLAEADFPGAAVVNELQRYHIPD